MFPAQDPHTEIRRYGLSMGLLAELCLTECCCDDDDFCEYVADTVPYNGFLLAYEEDVVFMEGDQAMFVAYHEHVEGWIEDKTWPP